MYNSLAPKVICFQKDLYALRPTEGVKDQRIESEAFGIADGRCAAALKEVVTGKIPADSETLETIAYFVGLQSSRLPSSGEYIATIYRRGAEEMMRLSAASVERMQSLIDQHAQSSGEKITVSAESMVEAVRGKHIQVEVTERPFIDHIFKFADFLARTLFAMSWDFLIAPDESGFILCDDPFVIVPPKGGKYIGIGIPGAVKYFPLSRKFCVRIGDPGNAIRYTRIDAETIQIINSNIAANSDRFVMGPDRKQLESVIAGSDTHEPHPTPRFSYETIDPTDHGSLQTFTRNPRKYFYRDSSISPP